MTATRLHFTTALCFAEFRALVATLLSQQPAGTALVCADGGRLTVDGGELYTYADDVLDVQLGRRRVDARSWDPDLGCFYRETVAHTWRHLTRPQYCHRHCTGVVLLRVRDWTPGDAVMPGDTHGWQAVDITPERISA